MSLLIRNGRVLTLAHGQRPRRGKELRDLGVLERGDVLVTGDRIAAVGVGLPIPAGTEVIEANGRVLMPGFVDCHTHACWFGERIDDWERQLDAPPVRAQRPGTSLLATVHAVREATKKQLSAQLKTRLDAMLRDGTTTVEVKSGYGLTIEAELKMLRAIVRAANEWPGTVVPTALLGNAYEGSLDDYAKMVVREMLPEVAREFSGIAIDACCAHDAWSAEACVRLFEKAHKRHPLRVQADQFDSLGMVPEAIRLGLRSVDQLEASTKADLLALAQSRTCGVILPSAGFHTQRRFARAGFLVGAGGAVALASGCNPGTAPTHSMPFAIALAVRFCGLTPAEAIAAGTVNSATALGLTDRGTIEPNQRADLLLLNCRDERALAYEFGGNPVETVVCAGRIASPFATEQAGARPLAPPAAQPNPPVG